VNREIPLPEARVAVASGYPGTAIVPRIIVPAFIAAVVGTAIVVPAAGFRAFGSVVGVVAEYAEKVYKGNAEAENREGNIEDGELSHRSYSSVLGHG
jgi:hypothetical protein